MKHFRKLIIENFQSHEYTEINFVPGLNVFVGPSDSGKSSILRALRWVLFNQPRGIDFIRTGATKCQVRLILDDETEIIRLRGKSVNRYILRANGEEEIYESFGQGPHPMILQAHQMIPLAWDQKETLLQFGSQLEGPFLLSESGGSKAKLIGRISGAHWIDLALKEATRERNQVLSEMRQVEKQKESIVERLESYHDVPQLEEAVKRAFEIYQHIQAIKQKLERLAILSKQLQTIRSEQEKQKELLSIFRNLSELERSYWKLEQQIYLLRQLNQLSQRWKRIQGENRQNQDVLQQTENISDAESSYLHMRELNGKMNKLKGIANRWDQHQSVKTTTQKTLHSLQNIPILIEEYEQLLLQIKQFQQLQQYHLSWLQLRQEKEKYNQLLSSTAHVMVWTSEKVPELEHQLIRYHRLTEVLEQYRQIQTSLSVGQDYLQQRIQNIEEISQEYMELLKLSGRCPTCGSPISASLLEHLEQELYGGGKYAAVGRADESDETKIGKG